MTEAKYSGPLETAIPAQGEVRIGVGENGELLIEQDALDWTDPDTIIIAAANVEAFVNAIQRLCRK
ncbi:hypothetical protein [Sinorhizobium meliloti]|uniref:hypothetical protein n=1 Tax=Rhizobium meliloti TaxID=382 RepID=UPI000FD88B1B|nr:hypothetical protein [Sinorhizobium meliloti]RVM15106.1 hypothetical protein CN134_15140 [Sinorhizobium meliloti]RVO28320.1 hypothetical protein CN098_21810 [Sinorhizobium meliloti]